MSDPVLREGLETAESSRPDLALFVICVLGGIMLYLLMHQSHVRQLVETGVICGIMLGYAGLICRIPRVRVRLDQAGDNAYYMGLLFTLTSMAIALYEFSENGGTSEIVSNFGIALASTICGIFLRVILHQMRIDPVDVENMTRIELSEATTRVRSILGTLTADVALFHKEMHQRLSDAVEDFTLTYRRTTEAYQQGMSEATHKMLAAAEEHETGIIQRGTALMKLAESTAESALLAADRLKAIEPPPANFAIRLEQTAERLAALVAPIESLKTALQGTSASATDALERMVKMTERVLATDTQDRSHRAQLLQDISAAATELQTALAKAGTTLQEERGALTQLEEDARRASTEAVRAAEAANEVLRTLTEVTRGLTQVMRGETAVSRPQPLYASSQ